jgi:integrase
MTGNDHENRADHTACRIEGEPARSEFFAPKMSENSDKLRQKSGGGSRVKRAQAKIKGVFKRDGDHWVRWTCTIGHEHREKVGPRGLAKERHAARRREVREARREGRQFCPDLIERQRPVMFRDIVRDHKAFSEANKKSHKDDRPRYARLLKAFKRKLASDIRPQDVEAFKAELARTARGGRRGGRPADRMSPLKVATINHHLKLLKAIFNRAIKTGKLTFNPVRAVKLFKENNARNRCLSPEEESRLFEHLPENNKPLVTVALHTGMRQGELLALRWDDLDFFTGTIRVREAKSGEGRSVVMNSVVRAALQSVRREQIQKAKSDTKGRREIYSPFVFCSHKGRFLHNLAKAWYPALEAAGIKDFRFHDLRHTFASRLAMAGVDLYTIQRLGGWKTAIMVQRYAHLSPDHMRAAVERLAGSRTGTQTGTRGFGGNPSDGVSAEEQMVTRVGIEPTTPGLKGRYSAN